MVTEEGVRLEGDQQRLVQAVYDRYRETGSWPTFDDIDRQLDRGRWPLDAGKVVRDIPNAILVASPFAATNPDHPLKLKLEGVALCKGGEEDVALFLAALRWLARQYRAYRPPEGAPATPPTFTSKQLARGLKLTGDSVGALRRLSQLVLVEPCGWSGMGGPHADGTWHISVSRDVRRFRSVQSLDDYRAVQEQWSAEYRSTEAAWQEVSELPPDQSPAVTGVTYVPAEVVAAIEAAQDGSQWDCRKLLAIIHELNDNYAAENGNSVNALLRALIDHVPPVFGCKNFNEVVNNVAWGQTDGAYMRQLANFKAQGDDALHRQIDTKQILLLTIDDLPARRAVNRLLEACAARL